MMTTAEAVIEYAPIAVEGQEGQGAEDVEVGLDPPPAEMDQQ